MIFNVAVTYLFIYCLWARAGPLGAVGRHKRSAVGRGAEGRADRVAEIGLIRGRGADKINFIQYMYIKSYICSLNLRYVN